MRGQRGLLYIYKPAYNTKKEVYYRSIGLHTVLNERAVSNLVLYAQSTITVISGQCEGSEVYRYLKRKKSDVCYTYIQHKTELQWRHRVLQVHTTQNENAVTSSCFTGTYNATRNGSGVNICQRYIQYKTKRLWRHQLLQVHTTQKWRQWRHRLITAYTTQNEMAVTSPAV